MASITGLQERDWATQHFDESGQWLWQGQPAASGATSPASATDESGYNVFANSPFELPLPAPAPAPAAPVVYTLVPAPAPASEAVSGVATNLLSLLRPPHQRTNEEWARIAALWNGSQGDVFRLMQQMSEHGWDAADLAYATQQQPQAVGDWLTRMGAPAGFGGAVTAGRQAMDQAYLDALNQAITQAPPTMPWTVGPIPGNTSDDSIARDPHQPWWLIQTHTQYDNNFQRAYLDVDAFTQWYVQQPSPQAQAFARIHQRSTTSFQSGGADQDPQISVSLGSGAILRLIVQRSNQESSVGNHLSVLASNIDWASVAMPQGPAPTITSYASYPAASQASRDEASLLLRDSLNEEVLRQFGDPALSLPPGEQGERMRARYGTELATQLWRLDRALFAVRQAYANAMDAAIRNPQYAPLRQLSWEGERVPETMDSEQLAANAPGWSVLQRSGYDNQFQWTRFNPQAFTDWYVAQDTPASKLFDALYGGQLAVEQTLSNDGPWVQTQYYMGLSGEFRVHVGGTPDGLTPVAIGDAFARMGLISVPLDASPQLRDASEVGFDPTMGFVTTVDNFNSDPDWTDSLIPLLIGAAAGAVLGPMAATAMKIGVGATAVVGAGVGAAVATTTSSLLLTGRVDMDDVLKSAVTAMVTAGLVQNLGLDKLGLGLDAAGRAVVTDWGQRILAMGGQATISGILRDLTGGSFGQGFVQSMASSLAAEVVRAIDLAASRSLTPEQGSSYRYFGRCLGAAIRIIGTPGDPAHALALNYVNQLGAELGAYVATPVPSAPAPATSMPDPAGPTGPVAAAPVVVAEPEPEPTPAPNPAADLDYRNGPDIESDQVTAETERTPNPHSAAPDPNPVGPPPTEEYAGPTGPVAETPEPSEPGPVAALPGDQLGAMDPDDPDENIFDAIGRVQAELRDLFRRIGIVVNDNFVGPLSPEQRIVAGALLGLVVGQADAQSLLSLTDGQGRPLFISEGGQTQPNGALSPEQFITALSESRAHSAMSLYERAKATVQEAVTNLQDGWTEAKAQALKTALEAQDQAIEVVRAVAAAIALPATAPAAGGSAATGLGATALAALAVLAAAMTISGDTPQEFRSTLVGDRLRFVPTDPHTGEGLLQERNDRNEWVITHRGVTLEGVVMGRITPLSEEERARHGLSGRPQPQPPQPYIPSPPANVPPEEPQSPVYPGAPMEPQPPIQEGIIPPPPQTIEDLITTINNPGGEGEGAVSRADTRLTIQRSDLSVTLNPITGEGMVRVSVNGQAYQVGIISVVDGSPQFYLDKRIDSEGASIKIDIEGIGLTRAAMQDTILAYRNAYGVAPPSLPGQLADANLMNFRNEFALIKASNPDLGSQEIGDLAIRRISYGTARINVGYGSLTTRLSNFDANGIPTRVSVNARPAP